MADPFKYWAFISYSHADETWAKWLHRSLERYAIPARLVGQSTAHVTVPARLFPVFRDRDELAGSAQLAPELQKALRESSCLIVICSPNAARSPWVAEEIRYFKALGRRHRVLALIVDGEPHSSDPGKECFPRPLQFDADDGGALSVPAEPIAADARPTGDGRKNALVKLVAGILGVGYDDLRQRDLQARHRRLAIFSAAVSAFASLTLVLAIQAYRARNDALRRQEQAEDLIEFMLGDLRSKLEPIGKLSILDSVGHKAMNYFASLDPGDRTDATLAARARALRQIGDVRLRQGNMPEAAQAYEEALALDHELIERHPNDLDRLEAIATSEFAMGNAFYVKGEQEQARYWIGRNAVSAHKLLEHQPENARWLSMVADSNSNLGAIAFQARDYETARRRFIEARDAQLQLTKKHPQDHGFAQLLAQYYGWLSAVNNAQRRWQDAVNEATAEAAVMRRLSELEPDNAGYREQLAAALIKQINNRLRFEPPLPADAVLQESLAISEQLAALDPENIDYTRMRRICLGNLEDALVYARQFRKALEVDREAVLLARQLHRQAPERADLADDLLRSFIRSARLKILAEDADGAARMVSEGLALRLTDVQRSAIADVRWIELRLLASTLTDRNATDIAELQQLVSRTISSGGDIPADLMFRYETLRGNPAEARRWLSRVSRSERQHPYLTIFCIRYSACATVADPALKTTAQGASLDSR